MTTKKKKAPKLVQNNKPALATPRTRFVKALIAHGKRLQKAADQLQGSGTDTAGDHKKLRMGAQAAFDVAETVQDTFPADWRPRPNGPAKKSDWKPGQLCTITKSWRSVYDGFIEEKQMDLVLDSIKDKHAVVKLPDGSKARVRLNHLTERQ